MYYRFVSWRVLPSVWIKEYIYLSRSMSLLLGNVHNQIHHANNAPVTLIAQHGFEFKCSPVGASKYWNLELSILQPIIVFH